MLTRIRIRNFKRFEDTEIELGKAVLLIGPNNSGKTTALQALSLWDIGLRRWNEKRKGKSSPEKRPGVTVNRRDLASIPVPVANLLWRNLHVRNVLRESKDGKLSPSTENIRVDIIVEGVTHGKAWSCGLEFDYANEESFYCRPLRIDATGKERMAIPDEAGLVRIAYLPPMSGLTDREYLKQPGEISVLIGQGQTAQVLRNLCYQIYQDKDSRHWKDLLGIIKDLFGIEILEPKYVDERSEITMAYNDERKNTLDLSSAGRGLQQTLLLFAHLYSNPGSVLLLDEPDAHLEVLRQRQTYNLLIGVAEKQGSQIIAASHSEVVLNEAAGRSDTVIAFVGKPHRIDDRGSQVLKALRDIGFEQYYQAEETGWVLYLENATDLAILQEFAKSLDHEAQSFLARPFVKYVETNLPQKVREHFGGLSEAKNDLVGIAIFDRLDKTLQPTDALNEMMWHRREIENYFCREDVLLAYARHDQPDDLFGREEAERRVQAMREAIEDVTKALEIDDLSPWSPEIKATDQVLDRVFRLFFKKLGLSLQFRKSEYSLLAGLVPKEELDVEIAEKLDAIVEVAKKAKPKTD
jgi:ABC-type phosphate/phosphonate transport system ATPase subunit